jgi:hypothetical protein
MKKGILIIATASPIYGRMAYNLALTIKATGTEIPIALIHDATAIRHLLDEHLDVFDERILTDKNWNEIRFNIDHLSPFDFTMQLDADMLWLWRDPAQLFAEHTDVELLVTNEGYFDIDAGTEHITGGYPWLADRDETVKKYKLKGKLYQMRWETLLFKKTPAVRKMLAMAESIRKKPKLPTWVFEGQPVDEFAFQVASNKCGLDQKQSPFLPAYWCNNGHNATLAQLNNLYFAVGFGGNSASSKYRRVYDHIMTLACEKTGKQHLFPLVSKSHYLPSRTLI